VDVGLVQDDTEALVGGHHGRDTYEHDRGSEDSVPAAGMGQDQQDGNDERQSDVDDTHGADEEDLGLVAVADGPADEVRVGLATERSLSDLDGRGKGSRVGGVLKSMEAEGTILVREVELAGRGEGQVVTHDAVDLLTVRLDGDYLLLAMRPQLRAQIDHTWLPLESRLSSDLSRGEGRSIRDG
jgi:hypothetical protein